MVQIRDSSGKPLDRVSVVRLGLLIGCLLTVAIAMIVLPIANILFSLFETARAIGPWGPLLMASAYIPASLFLVPVMILALGSGYLFGVVLGTITAWIGSTIGAAAAFIAARVLARELVLAGMSSNPKRQSTDQAIAEHGFMLTLLSRLTPLIPFNLTNYLLGLSGISLKQFVLGTWIGALPVTLMYVFLGTVVREVEETGGTDLQIAGSRGALVVVAAVVILALTAFVAYSIKKILDKAEPVEPAVPAAVPTRRSSKR
jgi:uncharacterized membrane protein YdjX (TVP38/TMEM64 family)